MTIADRGGVPDRESREGSTAQGEVPVGVRAFLAPIVGWLADEIAERLAPVVAVPEPAEWLPITACGLRPTTARRLIKGGTIEASRVGREILVSRASVARYIDGQRLGTDEGDELQRAVASARANGRAMP